LFAGLDTAAIRYCVLRNWNRLPQSVGNDVDLWVDAAHGSAFEEVLYRTAEVLGWHLVRRWQRLGYQAEGHFVLAKADGHCLLVIDAYRYLTWKGLRYADERVFPSHTRTHERGFKVVEDHLAAGSLLVKELLFEGQVRERYRQWIAEVARTRESSLLEALSAVVGPKMARSIGEAVTSGAWTRLQALRASLKIALVARSVARRPFLTAALCARHLYHSAKNRILPTGGFLLVFIGPDGAGKTTTAKALLESRLIGRLFSSGLYLYRRFPMFPELKQYLPSGLRKPPSVPAAEARAADLPPAGFVRCMAYLLYYGLEYMLGRAWCWKSAKLENRVIVFDRYWYEFVLQTRFERCPRVLLRLLGRLAAKPDAVVFLDVAPETAYDRKPEKPLAEIQRLHRICDEIIAESSNGFRLQAISVADSVRTLEGIVVERLAARAAPRLLRESR
jgi:thymidylate kinase